MISEECLEPMFLGAKRHFCLNFHLRGTSVANLGRTGLVWKAACAIVVELEIAASTGQEAEQERRAEATVLP